MFVKSFKDFLAEFKFAPKLIHTIKAAAALRILCFPISFKSMFLILTFLLFKSL